MPVLAISWWNSRALNNQYIHKVNDYNSLADKIFDLYEIDNLAKSSKYVSILQ